MLAQPDSEKDVFFQIEDLQCKVHIRTVMIRQEAARIDPKRRSVLDHKRKQFAEPTYRPVDYPHRLNLYEVPPTLEITLEQFEQWAIDRLRGKIFSRADASMSIF